MKQLLIGWAVIAAIVAPPLVGFLIAGPDGSMAVLIAYLVIELVLVFTYIAHAIGEIIHP